MPNIVRAALVQTAWTGDKESMVEKNVKYAYDAAPEAIQEKVRGLEAACRAHGVRMGELFDQLFAAEHLPAHPPGDARRGLRRGRIVAIRQHNQPLTAGAETNHLRQLSTSRRVPHAQRAVL